MLVMGIKVHFFLTFANVGGVLTQSLRSLLPSPVDIFIDGRRGVASVVAVW